MLSTVGRVASAITILAGAALLHPPRANAMTPDACSQEEIYQAECAGFQGAWCGTDGDQDYCWQVNGCIHVNSPGGDYIQWNATCSPNGPNNPCPGSLPCA